MATVREYPATTTPAANDGLRLAFLIGAFYDGILGLAFLLAYDPLLRALGAPVPDNPVSLQLAAGLIALIGLLQCYVWRDMIRNVDVVPMLVAIKAFFVLLAFDTWLRGDLPHWLFGLFAVIDVGFFFAYLAYLRAYGRDPRAGA